MQQVACPSCGAPVAFTSHASVIAVCEYCKTTVLKDADTVRDFGRMAEVLEDYSPLQIGTSGRYGGCEFTVTGRIQLRYDAGMWNEWFILFADGAPGWLSDASGQYAITLEKQSANTLPEFKDVRVGSNYSLLGTNFVAADVRVADCIGGQGELPFKVGAGWQAQLADFRNGKNFATLDYSESARPRIYTGEAVELDQLQCQLLRDDDAVRESAGKVKGKVQPLACPSCGSSVAYVPGVTRQVICPSCRAQLDTSTRVAQVLQVAERMAACKTTLALGARAQIGGASYQIIGAMIRRDEEGIRWTEYLLVSTRGRFLWLIETDEGWQQAKVLDDWPVWNRGQTARLGEKMYTKLYDYTATVVSAVGAFNWRVAAGDTAQVIEFEAGKTRLAAELTPAELTWSASNPVGADQMRAWFGLQIDDVKLAPKSSYAETAKYFMYGLFGVNFVPMANDFDATWLYSAFAAGAIYLPALLLDWIGDR